MIMDTAQNKKNLLIIEDETALAQAMKEALEQSGYSVDTAADGEEGLKLALSKQPELIILDILMPKVDGLHMLRNLRSSGEYGKNVKVVILTNLDINDAILKDVVEMLPTFYLIKADITMEGIQSKVNEVLSGEATATATATA
jgi:DNA-binding response OmpR family regulator